MNKYLKVLLVCLVMFFGVTGEVSADGICGDGITHACGGFDEDQLNVRVCFQKGSCASNSGA
jgi:hypothetical protein